MNPFRNLPDLLTRRLRLRRMRLSDAEDMYYYARDPDVARYVAWEPHRTIAESRSWIQHALTQYQRGQIAPWAIEYRPEARLIGTCGFNNWDRVDSKAEIGYSLSKPYWGRGLMTEAVCAMLTFGFDRMHVNRVEAMCEVKNVGSARVMEKAGMTYEGTLRDYVYNKGRYWDMKLYAILRREWEFTRCG